MAFHAYEDNLYHYIPGSGGIYNCRELKSEFVQELIFGEGSDQIPDAETLYEYAKDNPWLELKGRLNDDNSIPVFPVHDGYHWYKPDSWKPKV